MSADSALEEAHIGHKRGIAAIDEQSAPPTDNESAVSAPSVKKQKLMTVQASLPSEITDEIASIVAPPLDADQTAVIHEIVRFLSETYGVCVCCLYRICNGFPCFSRQNNNFDLMTNLMRVQQKVNTSSSSQQRQACFICADIYFNLYEALNNKNDSFVSSISGIDDYEFSSFFLNIKLPPLLTIRDFYVVHRVHAAIPQSVDLIAFPDQNEWDSQRDFLQFLMETQCRHFRDQKLKTQSQHYTAIDQVEVTGVAVTITFYHQFLMRYMRQSQLGHNDVSKTKQAKKKERYKKWKKTKMVALPTSECPEYELVKNGPTHSWLQKNHYLSTLKAFLFDVGDSFKVMSELCRMSREQMQQCSTTLDAWNYAEVVRDNVCDLQIEIKRPTLYIAGEYNKYSREVSQTPFAFTKTSIITLIVQQMRGWRADDADVDVGVDEPAAPGDTRNDTDMSDLKQNDDEDAKMMDVAVKGVDGAEDDAANRIVNPHSNVHGWIEIKQNVERNNIFCCDRVVLNSAGREDANVRMLGSGRPFLLQLLNPRKALSLLNSENTELTAFETFCNQGVNGVIVIKNLRIVDESYLEWMKSIENTKHKSYRAVCWCSRRIEDQAELDEIWKGNAVEFPLQIKQWTPIRVLHRRSLAQRDKLLHSMKLTWISSNWITVDVTAASGTYIKEFCHGDRGRTFPNLASLLQCKHANIVQLDVTEVHTGDSTTESTQSI